MAKVKYQQIKKNTSSLSSIKEKLFYIPNKLQNAKSNTGKRFSTVFNSQQKKNGKKQLQQQQTRAMRVFSMIFWFICGALIGFFFFVSFLYIFYQKSHENLIYDGVMVNNIDFGGKSKEQLKSYFQNKNTAMRQKTFELKADTYTATISAKQLGFGYDEELLAQQAYSIGRTDHVLTNISIILQAYINGIKLPPAYRYNEDTMDNLVKPLKQQVDKKPVNALFNFQDGKVVAFQLSKNGQTIDKKNIQDQIFSYLSSPSISDKKETISINVPIIPVKPAITSDKAANLGITELIGEGESLFLHSIENRVFNISLAASRLNGILIAPDEVFSFAKAVGDVSAFTGYKQAYVIENGKTVLGDGGGVCQVSTTLFRAILDAGLPIVERHPHAYRVGYYEQDSPPGIDAAVYVPTVDLKFKNDTGKYILIQSIVDPDNLQLIFQLYGTSDNREVSMTKPVILSESPAPEPSYQDDPTLPKGEVKQVDFAAPGAVIYFTRTVKKDGKVILSDKFSSNYKPWQAVYMRGTKE